MKKFLCYDTNDAASGKINVDNRGMLKPNSTVPSTNGAVNQYLVTAGDGSVKWEDRLAYDDSKLVIDFGGGAQYVKVADEVPSWASIDTPIKFWVSTGADDTESPERHIDLGNGSFMLEDTRAAFITTDNVVIDGTDVVFREKGVYFKYHPGKFDIYVIGITSADSGTPEITWDGKVENVKTIDPKYIPSELNEIILPSSTSGSSKKFKITVDDSGAITATEV